MNLKRKDDWDEALDEARNAAIERGEILPIKPFEPGSNYDYGAGYVLTFQQEEPCMPPS